MTAKERIPRGYGIRWYTWTGYDEYLELVGFFPVPRGCLESRLHSTSMADSEPPPHLCCTKLKYIFPHYNAIEFIKIASCMYVFYVLGFYSVSRRYFTFSRASISLQI